MGQLLTEGLRHNRSIDLFGSVIGEKMLVEFSSVGWERVRPGYTQRPSRKRVTCWERAIVY